MVEQVYTQYHPTASVHFVQTNAKSTLKFTKLKAATVAVSWDWNLSLGHLCGATQRITKAEQGGPREVSSVTQFSSGTEMPGGSSA